MQARRALRHFPYGGGEIEHLILCCHSVKTFAGAKVLLFFQICKEKRKKFGGSSPEEETAGRAHPQKNETNK